MKVVLLVVWMILIFLLIFGFAILVGNILAGVVLPKQDCPDCKTEMDVKLHNIYTGQVLYRCPKCGKEVYIHYDDNLYN